jgi:hypothetical protein
MEDKKSTASIGLPYDPLNIRVWYAGLALRLPNSFLPMVIGT